ncbi:MAG: hypothetical protein D6754_09845 [Alphaproteobacteria bacterium]|nr:MAG: hypothetical protein D6754_09845 [Alphaproteobacteria bacterium]
MTSYEIGDLVVLTAGSMRMAVEGVDGETVNTVWCHEGRIGRDSFHQKLLKKWEYREESAGRASQGDRDGGGRAYRGERSGGGKPWHGDRDGGSRDQGSRGRGSSEGSRQKTGWDGKPREKKYFRKD